MESHDATPDPPPTEEQQAKIDRLTPEQVRIIDEALLANVIHCWRKVAFIIGTTMSELPSRPDGIPDVYYASRIRKMIESGVLEYQGWLPCMRYCEVRLIPAKTQYTD